MIEIDSTYPDSEDILLAVNRSVSQAREAINDLEQIVKRVLEGKTFISDEEVADIFHCEINEIPAKLVKYRPVAKRGYVYKIEDVYKFIESKRIGGR